MGLVGKTSWFGAKKLLGVGLGICVGYLIANGTFSEMPEYQKIKPGQIVEYEGAKYELNLVKEGPNQGKPRFDDITDKIIKNEDEVILGKRYRTSCSGNDN